jgi:HIP---CoA ligase
MPSHPQTIPAALDHIARELPDHNALVTEDRTLTFAELRDEVRRAAAAMISLGVNAGDRVAIWSPNSWHWVVACLATHYAGGIVVPLNTRYTAAEASDILARTGAPLLVAMGQFLGADRISDLDRSALPDLRHVVRVPIDVDDGTWDEFVSRGTDLAAADARAAAVRPGYLCINPFFHNFGYKAGILACLQTGATLIPQLTFDAEQALRAVAEHRITVLPGPPTIYQTLLDHPARSRYDLSSLRFAVTGAATVPVVLIERMQTELDFDIVLTAYGLTESNGMGTMCRADDDAVTVATTCGRPIADFELRIDDTTGEVLLRGPNVMLGYLDDPDATAAAIDSDGWLHTGDIGKLDAAGNLQITDRLKDMYICGGFNVYPAEIEQVLARLDGVVDCAVIGVPDERLGEVGRAFLVARNDSGLDEKSVIAYTREFLANFKAPRSVRFVDALPRNAGGKVVKPLLREMA